jgi:hypothetical protein
MVHSLTLAKQRKQFVRSLVRQETCTLLGNCGPTHGKSGLVLSASSRCA